VSIFQRHDGGFCSATMDENDVLIAGTNLCMYVCMYAYMHVCRHVCVCVYVIVCDT
jgi:hypothetical protein